jgi:O-antigen/teichoic acid export membrane protein
MVLQGGMRQVISVYFQELVRDDRRAELRAAIRKIFQYSLLAGGSIVVGTFFFGRETLQILFGGSSWEPAEIQQLWQLCCISSFMILVACLGGLLVQAVIATKNFRFCMTIEITKLCAFAVAASLLVRFDIYGLAAAQIIQQTIGTGLVLVFLGLHLQRGLRGRDLILIGRILAVSAPTVLALWLGRFVADQFGPLDLTMAVKRLLVILLCAAPGAALTVWFGACWAIPPLDKAMALWRTWIRRAPATPTKI